MRSLARILVCAWALWQLFVVDGEQKFVRLATDLSAPGCLAAVREKAPYERRLKVVRFWADISPEAKRLHPAGLWYGCFPAEIDPDPKAAD